jgi:hypothetical protein
MKKEFLLICLLSFLLAPVFAQDYAPSIKKFYFRADQIELTDSMILIHLENQTFEIDAIAVDQGGIYFTENMLRCTYCRRPLNPKNTCECPLTKGAPA